VHRCILNFFLFAEFLGLFLIVMSAVVVFVNNDDDDILFYFTEVTTCGMLYIVFSGWALAAASF